jgi:hypothetical protein
MVEAPFVRAPMLDRILQSRSLASSSFGDWISDDQFSTKTLFARSAARASCSF